MLLKTVSDKDDVLSPPEVLSLNILQLSFQSLSYILFYQEHLETDKSMHPFGFTELKVLFFSVR